MKYFILISVFMLNGCQMLAEYQEKGSEEIAKLVITYCATTDEIYRAQLRNQVNEKLNGLASIQINCN